MTYFAVPILTGAAFFFIAAGLGAIASRFFFKGTRQPLIESFALGALVISLATMVLGTAGLLGQTMRPFIAVFFAIISIFGWVKYRPSIGNDLKTIDNVTTLAIVLLFTVGVVLKISLDPLLPPTGWDECSYHLPGALKILGTGKDTFYPDIIFCNTPRNTGMLFFWTVAWSPLSSSHYVNFLAFLFTLILTARLGGMLFSVKTGWLAALILATWSHLQWLTIHSYNDIWILFYILIALLSIVEGMKNGSSSRIVLAGVFLGAAAGTKFTALPAILTLVVALALIWLWIHKDNKSVPARSWLWAVLAALVVASPWYIRNLIWFHNPFFPFYTSIIAPGGGLFGYYAQECAYEPKDIYIQYSVAHNAAHGRLLTLIGKHLYPFGGILLGALLLRVSPFFKFAVLWSVLSLAYYVFGVGGVLVSRYFVYLAPITALSAAYLLVWIYNRISTKKNWRFLKMLFWVFLFVWVGAFGVTVHKEKVPVSDAKRIEFLRDNVSSYDLIVAANEVIPHGDAAVGIMCEEARLYAGFTLLGGCDVWWANAFVIAEHCDSAKSLADLLIERYNAPWLVVNEERVNDDSLEVLVRIKLPTEDPEFEEYFEEEARVDSGVVYHVLRNNRLGEDGARSD